MYRDMSTKVIDLTPYLVQARRTGRREALRAAEYANQTSSSSIP